MVDNRAWSALGIAIRCAQGLGMHLKNITPKVSLSKSSIATPMLLHKPKAGESQARETSRTL